MMRYAFSMLMVAVAVLLLGVLVVLSTSIDEDSQRRLDMNLGHLRDVGLAVERDARNARNLGVDNSERLQALSTRLRASVNQVGDDLTQLYPEEPDVYSNFREKLLNAYNYVSSTDQGMAGSDFVTRDFAALDQSASWLNGRTESFNQNHSNFLELQRNISTASRDLSQELRQQGKRTVADMVFQSVQQILSKSRRGSENDLTQTEALISRLQEKSKLLSTEQREHFAGLIEDMRNMLPFRHDMEEDLKGISSGRFLRQVSSLKELVTRDYLFRLTTINESRILLNVYTIMLLLVLVYFGIRLQRSYRTLNRSHEALEERVLERTQDLESAYQNLSESQVQLVQAEKMSSLGQLVAGVMHEINTPLLYIKNNADMVAANVEDFRAALVLVKGIVQTLKEPNGSADHLKKQLADLCRTVDPSTMEENLQETITLTEDSREGLDQIGELVQSLKDFSRLDRANEDRFDVREGLEKTLIITRNMLKTGVDVQKHFQEVPEILCAPSRINQIFINLITNAVQAMDGEGTLTLSTRCLDGWVEVSVEDTGCGISQEHINKVMDPFFTTKPVGEGTGLGLSIVNQIVEEHGGSMEISSEEGVGTHILIRLPVADQHSTDGNEAEAA